MKTATASAPSDLHAASLNKAISIQRDMINLPPKLKRKMLTWAREENAETDNEVKEVQASATRIVVRLPKRTAKQTPVKKVEENKTKAKGKAKASVAIEEKALDEPDLRSTESPSMPPPKKRKTEAGPAPKGDSEVDAATGRRRSQRIKAAAEASAQRRSH